MIIHKNFMTSRRHSNPYTGYLKQELFNAGTMITPRERADQLDISEEARKTYAAQTVITLEHARIKKLVKSYMPMIKTIIGRDGDQRNLIRLAPLRSMKEAFLSGKISWEKKELVTDVAEKIIALYS